MSRTRPTASLRPHLPLTFWLGLAAIGLAEMLLVVDVVQRNSAAGPAPPTDVLQSIGRAVGLHMTPLCWTAYLLVCDGLSGALTGSPVRLRPRRFAFCFLASVPIWLWFDWINFFFIHAWAYHGLPSDLVHRYLMYFIAFGAICPAMFLTAELCQQAGLHRLKGRPLRLGPTTEIVLVALGSALLVFPFIVRDPVGSLTMWLAWILLLDPLNARLGAPSIIGDWRAGRYGRTVALLVAGLACGLLWEFWNYWAAAKWTYQLPFLGHLEAYRLFEMPLLGFLGFPPFAVECWVMFQTVLFLGSKLRPRLVEPLPGTTSVI